MSQKLSFTAWMAAVDARLIRSVGICSGDLPDQCYADWYEDEMTPAEAAKEALAEMLESY